jgi:hypothetical protein
MAHYRLYNLIEYVKGTENRYIFMDTLEGPARTRSSLMPNSPDWFTWLAKLSSFHFTGKAGHFTSRQEAKQRGDTYWYAYRKAHRQRLKRYLGTTTTLTLAKLEQIAGELQDAALGTIGEDEALNARPLKPAPDGLNVGPLTILWQDEVLRIKTPTEQHLLNRQQTAELLSYLYDQRDSLLKPYR